MENNYREQILARLDKQDEKGMAKYGTILEQNPADMVERLDHLAEELVDGLRYIEWIKDCVLRKQPEKKCTTCSGYLNGGCSFYKEAGAKVCRDSGFAFWKEQKEEVKRDCNGGSQWQPQEPQKSCRTCKFESHIKPGKCRYKVIEEMGECRRTHCDWMPKED